MRSIEATGLNIRIKVGVVISVCAISNSFYCHWSLSHRGGYHIDLVRLKHANTLRLCQYCS